MKLKISSESYQKSLRELNKLKKLAEDIETPYMKALKESIITEDHKYLKDGS